ncbi:hypothetical protein [Paenibacillus glacialis]|uniref:Uncharacterized protein n=1 Tax=Paenibacillus glacialis TaxID=494026 RepID=A0A168LQI8_9BACL|nr:hypothetical protein [Paenibacillus glacialis]OAB43714.1 hypothetical protein PGLA_07990 [Paenibacillus glacialis]
MINSTRLIFILLLLILTVGCTHEKIVKPDSPENLSYLASVAINNQDFNELKSYFTDSSKETLDDQYFEDLIGINSHGVEHRTYSLLRMIDQDQIVLLEIVKNPENNNYEIQNIIKVPKEYGELFSNK